MPFPRNATVPDNSPHKRRDLLKICSIASLILLPLMWVWELYSAESSSLSALLLYLPQHFYLLLPTLLAVVALRKRRLRLLLLNGLALVFCVVFPLGWQLHFPSSPRGNSIRFVTFNIQRGEGDEPRVEEALHSLRPDVVCLQESGRSGEGEENSVGRQIARGFPGWNARYAGDVTTLSRLPMVSQHIYPLRGTRRTLETVLQTPSGPLRVLNTHVSTSFKGNRMPTSKLDHLALLYKTAQPSAQARLNRLPSLRAAIESGNPRTPLVLTGDFNTPPHGHFYNGLARDLKDAFAQVGNGLGLTFPSRFPLLRIDFVWTRGVRAKRAFVGNPSGSDHRPLITDIEVAP